jgi:RNA polymerase sigma-70 factor (ECF subfamily)
MKSFEDLYRAHMDPVFRYALRLVGRRDIAEEITSEAFLALYRCMDRIDVTQLPGWLYTAAKNRAVDYWRHRAVEKRYFEQLPDLPTRPNAAGERWLLGSKALKPIHRICLILRYVYGMERPEIAQYTGLNDNQIKSSLQYALRLLRKELKVTS